jgi:hypothetical protein
MYQKFINPDLKKAIDVYALFFKLFYKVTGTTPSTISWTMMTCFSQFSFFSFFFQISNLLWQNKITESSVKRTVVVAPERAEHCGDGLKVAVCVSISRSEMTCGSKKIGMMSYAILNPFWPFETTFCFRNQSPIATHHSTSWPIPSISAS